MKRGFIPRGEQTGRFNHNLHAQVFPRHPGRIPFRENFERPSIEHDSAALGFYLMLELSVDRIVLQQMSKGGCVCNVIDGYDLEFLFVERCAQEHSANPAETVDANSYGHRKTSSINR